MVTERTRELEQTNLLLEEAREAAVRKGKVDWERTFDAIDDIVTIQDVNMRLVNINQAGCARIGKKSKEIVGRLCNQILVNSDEPCQGCPAFKVLLDQNPHVAEIEHHHQDRIFLESASPVFDDQGRLDGIVHIARDITKQKKILDQLQHAQKMESIGTLASGIAHDFNNIVGGILGFSELALINLEPGTLVRGYLERICLASERAADLATQILTFSRKGATSKQPTMVNPIVKEALKLLRSSMPSTIDIQSEIPTKLPMIMANPTQVYQVVMNICTNAFQAMGDQGGSLVVNLTETRYDSPQRICHQSIKAGHYLKLSVKDSGSGIEPGILAHVFEPFFTTKEE